jgi:Tfp pilus assembly protein PilV
MVIRIARSRSRRPAGSRPPATDERGFTLVEATVASLVLTVGLVAVAELLTVSTRMHKVGRDSAQAARLAQDKVEELMKMNFATSPAVQLGGELTSNVADHFDVPDGSGYTRRWQVVAGPNANPRLRTVTVRLVPDVPMGAPYEVTMVIRSW